MKRNPRALTLFAVSLVCVLLLAACCSSSNSPQLRYITISPTSATIAATTTQQFTATGYYSNGSIAPGIAVTWTSSAPAVASIDPVMGVATGVAPGTTTINAYSLGITATSATLTVNQLLSLTISPLNQTVPSGGTEQFDAMGTFKNADGTTTTTDVTTLVTWTSSNMNIFTISTGGLATSVGPNGSSQITAALDGLTASTYVTVGPAAAVSLVITPATPNIAVGNSLLLTAQEQYSDGTLHNPAGAVTWSSDTTADANVVSDGTTSTGAAAGLVAAYAAGSANITATEGTITGTIPVTVVAGTTHFAYVSNSGGSSPGIGEYTVKVATSPYLTSSGNAATTGQSPSITVLDPNGQYLYLVATVGSNTGISVFTVNTTSGALTAPTGSPTLAGPTDINYGAIDPFGRFLYVSDYNANSIYAFQISQTDGSLTAVSGSPFTTNVSGPSSILVDRSGQFLYVVNNVANNVSIYNIDQTLTATGGALTPPSSNATIPTGTSPALATLDPAGAFLYVANSGDQTVSTYSVASGVLTNVNTTVALTATSVQNVAVDPSDTYLYVLDGGTPPADGQVFLFTLASGIPSTAPVGSPIATGLSPDGMAIDPTSSILAVDNAGDGSTASTISIYTIGTGGALTAQTPVPAGVGPLYVTFYDAP